MKGDKNNLEVKPKNKRRATFASKAWKRFRKNPLVLFGLGVLTIIVFLAVSASIISPQDPNKINYDSIYAPPSIKFPLGADELGRDVLSRVIWGARTSLMVGVFAVAISVMIGVTVGSISGYYGKRTDVILMRLTEIMMTIPSLFFAIIMVSVFKVTGILIIIAIIGFLGWAPLARVVRSEILSLKERPYIEASRAMGDKDILILLRDVLPNVITPITIIATMRMGQAILIESSLSFLGLGDPTVVTWGRMLVQGQSVLTVAWWIAAYPGLAIFITILGFNLLGDGIRDALDVRI